MIKSSEVIEMFFSGKELEVYSAEKEPSKSNTLDYHAEFCHILHPYKHIVKVSSVWVKNGDKKRPLIIDFRLENKAGGYGNMNVYVDEKIYVVGFPN